MSGWHIKIATIGGSIATAESWKGALSKAWSAHRGAAHQARWSVAAHDDINDLEAFDALVLLPDAQATSGQAAALLDAAGECGVPVLVLTSAPLERGNYYEFAGAMVELQSVPPQRLCALLEGMLHRQHDIRQLKAEVALNERCHGGLEGQIAKIHEELQLAAMVQREFLPRDVPNVHGVQIAALWRPTNYVSGDIYDVSLLDDDRVGVFVADAVGHGVPAALMTMVICRSLVVREIHQGVCSILSPAEVLRRLNAEMIRRQGPTTRFVTAVYAVIDCRRRTAQFASAGHPAPVLLHSSGQSETLSVQGGLLGVFPDEAYEQLEIDLDVDDRLLFYTDGFEQAFPSNASDHRKRRIPTGRYRNEFDQLSRAASAAEMVESINRRLNDQAGSLHQVDDMTLVCVHAGPLDSTCCATAPQRKSNAALLYKAAGHCA